MSQTAKEQREELLRMQRLLLPASLPRIGCTEAAAAYRADNSELRLGGDWFDLVDRPESNSIVAIVGDVVGHGVEQISVMGQLRAASSALAHAVDGPSDILSGLDRFAKTLPGAEFATLCVMVFDGSPHARICSAGHPPPVMVTGDGETRVIEAGRRPPLTLSTEALSDGTFPLAINDVLLMYTDGVVERRAQNFDANLAELGEFLKSRRHQSCRDIAAAVVDDFKPAPEDDQAVLVIRPLHKRDRNYRLHRPTESAVSWPRSD